VNDTKGGVIKEVQVHCVPFFSIYKAIGREEIDLFVLDIEGHEVEVLHTIPWDKVNILVKFAIKLIIRLKREIKYLEGFNDRVRAWKVQQGVHEGIHVETELSPL
jgi:Methyltransferase FkbM domain